MIGDVTRRDSARALRVHPLAGDFLPSFRATPFTCCYLVELVGASLFLWGAEPNTVQRVVAAASTDAAHLATAPMQVLVASALLPAAPDTPPSLLVLNLLLCGGSLALLEKRIGSMPAAAIFAAGHVLANLATELPIALAVGQRWLPDGAAHRVDVGVSFGLCACIGVGMGLLGRARRPWALAAVVGSLTIAGLVFGDPVAAAGHPLALLVGVACRPSMRRRSRG